MHHSVTLNGHRFYIRRMEAFTALGVLATLQKSLLGPVLRGATGKQLTDAGAVTEALVSGLETVSNSLGPNEAVSLARVLLNPDYVSVEVRSDSGAYAEAVKLRDSVVATTLNGASDLLTLCIEVVKVNYADFLERLAPLISSATSLLEQQQASSPKS